MKLKLSNTINRLLNFIIWSGKNPISYFCIYDIIVQNSFIKIDPNKYKNFP
jgi:hypothetical protein